MAFVSSKFNPQFILWNGSIMPCKPTASKINASINLPVISFLYLSPPIRMHTHTHVGTHSCTHTHTHTHLCTHTACPRRIEWVMCKPVCLYYLLITLNLLQCIERSAFIARAWFVGMTIGSFACARSYSRSFSVNDWISALRWIVESPPLMTSWIIPMLSDRRLRVFLHASELGGRHLLTAIKASGCLCKY